MKTNQKFKYSLHIQTNLSFRVCILTSQHSEHYLLTSKSRKSHKELVNSLGITPAKEKLPSARFLLLKFELKAFELHSSLQAASEDV